MASQSNAPGLDRYAKADRRRPGVWRSAILSLIALIVFVAIVAAIDAALKPQLEGLGLLLVGIVLALVPAALWLIFFYLQDRLEPEPVGHVAQIFVIGLALAGAIGVPLIGQVFKVQDWLYRDTGTAALGGIFVVGAVETFILYATVRYFIFDSPEFDERSDGVVYGTAAGLGYATAANLQFILSNGGAALGAGEIYVAETALAYAAFGGLLGYFLGHAKLQRDPVWWLPLGFVLTAVVNGLFLVLRGQLDSGSLTLGAAGAGLPSLTGLILAGVLAVVMAAIVALLMNRDIQRAQAGKLPKAEGADLAAGDRQANWAVIVACAAFLIIGLIGWNAAVNGTTAFDASGVRGAYPAAFSPATAAGDAIRVADRTGTGAEFAVRVVELKQGQDAKAVSSLLAAGRAESAVAYKVSRTATETVNGRTAVVQEFAYVDSSGLTGAPPQVIQGVDYIFVSGTRAVVVTLVATPDTLAAIEPQFKQFLGSLSFQS